MSTVAAAGRAQEIIGEHLCCAADFLLHATFRQMRFPWQLGRMRLNGGLEQQEPPQGVGLRHAAVGWL